MTALKIEILKWNSVNYKNGQKLGQMFKIAQGNNFQKSQPSRFTRSATDAICIDMSQEKQICRMRAQHEANGVPAETVIAEPPSYLE